MKLKLGKKAMDIPIGKFFLFVALLVILVLIVITVYKATQGELGDFFGGLKSFP